MLSPQISYNLCLTLLWIRCELQHQIAELLSQWWSGFCSITERHGKDGVKDGFNSWTARPELGWWVCGFECTSFALQAECLPGHVLSRHIWMSISLLHREFKMFWQVIYFKGPKFTSMSSMCRWDKILTSSGLILWLYKRKFCTS